MLQNIEFGILQVYQEEPDLIGQAVHGSVRIGVRP